jgi:quercetin dioxygenase-like cupin family protein
MNLSRMTVVAVTTLLVGGVAVSSAGATPPSSGDLAPVPSDSVSGSLDDSGRRVLRVAQDRVELKVKRATTVTSFDLTYPAGSESGWHSHPGIVVVVVKEGTVVRQTPCESETFTVGDAFTEVGPHHVSNPGPEPAVLAITRIYPTEDAATPRIDAPEPQCR